MKDVQPFRRLWSFQLRAIVLVCWLTSFAVMAAWIRLAVARHESRIAVATLLGLSLAVGFLFWGGFRLRVDLYDDSLVVVRGFSQIRIPKTEIDDVEFGEGGLWGQVLVLKTSHGLVRIPAFSSGTAAFGRDSMSLREMAGARYEIRRWLATPDEVSPDRRDASGFG